MRTDLRRIKVTGYIHPYDLADHHLALDDSSGLTDAGLEFIASQPIGELDLLELELEPPDDADTAATELDATAYIAAAELVRTGKGFWRWCGSGENHAAHIFREDDEPGGEEGGEEFICHGMPTPSHYPPVRFK